MRKLFLLILALSLASPAFADSSFNSTVKAGRVSTSTTNFSGNLSSADNTVQRALDTLDDLSIPSVAVDVNKSSFGITIDGGGSAITTGVKGYVTIPFDCTITGWVLTGDQSGSIVIDVWRDTYANFPPTVADTIAGSEKPTLSSVQKNQDLTLSSWTTTVTEGDVIGFNVDSATTVTKVTLIVKVTKV